MEDRKANLLITMVFDKDSDIRKQINTELELKDEITKDLQHLITGKEIKHFAIADDEVINKKLTQEYKVGKWDILACDLYMCSKCYAKFTHKFNYCPTCGAEMRGSENGKNN